MNQVDAFALGLSAPLNGLRLLVDRPGLLRWAIVPFVIGLVVFIFGGFFGFAFLLGFLPEIAWTLIGLIPLNPDGYTYLVLYWLILIFAWPLACVVLLYICLLLAKLLAAPFFTLLAERVIENTLNEPQKPFRFGGWLRSTFQSGGIALAKLLIFSLAGFVFFLIAMIPGLGLVTGAGVLFLVAVDIADSAFDAFEFTWRERIAFIRSHLPFFSGLSLAMGLAFLLPGLNFVLLPIAIAGVADGVRHLRRTEV